jgi:hypothetical protein
VKGPRSYPVLTPALGFPPPDDDVRKWLLDAKTKIGFYACWRVFMLVLLRSLQVIDAKMDDISQLYGLERPQSLEGKFRLLMTAGQSFSRQGQPRRQFYHEVLELADEVWHLCFIFILDTDVLLLPDVVAAVTIVTRIVIQHG